MSPISYSDVYDIDHGRGYEEEIAVGDLVRTGLNLFPHYRVIAINGDKVWVQNTESGADALAFLDRCRKINGQTEF
jgi:hypothetical protein